MRTLLCLIVALVVVGDCLGQEIPKFIDVPLLSHRLNENTLFADIVNRCHQPSLGNGRATDGHESTHMMNSQLRNQIGRRVNAFYVLYGRGVVVNEPGIRKSHTITFVPQSLRESRFSTYVSGQNAWDDTPTYLIDEWVAYVNGCLIALDDRDTGHGHDNSDRACGPLELGIYSVAMAMAIEKHDPAFWKTDAQFRAFMRWHWQRTCDVFNEARHIFPFESQEKLSRNLKNSSDAVAMREFIKVHLGAVFPK